MSETLETLLTPMTLVRSTDRATLQRAQPYAEGDAITWLTAEPQRLEARVQGSRPQPYVVEFAVRNGELSRRCNCPMGNEGGFCKHLAAVALAWLAGRAAAGLTEGELPAIRRHLQSLPAAELVELLMQHAVEDQALRARLLRAAQNFDSRDGDPERWRQALQRTADAFCGLDYDDYYQRNSGYGTEVSNELCELADALKQRFDAGGRVPMALVEEAIEVLHRCCRHASEWVSSELCDRLDTLVELHQLVLRRDPSDPAALAAHLVELEIEYDDSWGDWEIWRRTARHYADVLGPAGLAEHRRIARERMETARAGQETADEHTYEVARDILIDHAQLAGDLDAEIGLLAERLSGTTTHLHIAEKLQAAGREDEALVWAERGLAADADFRGDWRLRPFLIERYTERGRSQEALALAWAIFDRSPRLQTYQELHALADRFGELEVWRPLALARLDAVARIGGNETGVRHREPDQSLRVEALCWEGEYADAWAVAKTGHCARHVLERLADASADAFPAEAAAVYRRLADGYVNGQISAYGYEDAVLRLRKLRPLLEAEVFAAYVDDLRQQHRRKRSFMKLLAEF
ncbi:SWIM zinc finger domain-containing protein [Plasticicumulans sp.]|uniref:SWIM zinc finger family protein n=1 Tax=Plasticicumulans sp. TaxID=2307179 RepID=UPI00393C29BF